MKSSKEWSDEWNARMADLGYEGFLDIEFVEAIQADAHKQGFRDAETIAANSLASGVEE